MGVSQLQYMLYLRETGCPGLRTACSVIGKEIMKMRWNGLTSSDLKWIAIISMLVDHFAVAIYANMADYQFDIYRVMRGIGRIAFPIYCFLLVEGFCHTHDVKRYISRCFLFAVISEVPFDLAPHGAWVYPE